jgi:hypothetical protein
MEYWNGGTLEQWFSLDKLKAWIVRTSTEDLRSFGYGRILFPFT